VADYASFSREILQAVEANTGHNCWVGCGAELDYDGVASRVPHVSPSTNTRHYAHLTSTLHHPPPPL
jgi:hypothetical protein